MEASHNCAELNFLFYKDSRLVQLVTRLHSIELLQVPKNVFACSFRNCRAHFQIGVELFLFFFRQIDVKLVIWTLYSKEILTRHVLLLLKNGFGLLQIIVFIIRLVKVLNIICKHVVMLALLHVQVIDILDLHVFLNDRQV